MPLSLCEATPRNLTTNVFDNKALSSNISEKKKVRLQIFRDCFLFWLISVSQCYVGLHLLVGSLDLVLSQIHMQ